jgi:flagellar biosynthesis chaperone FliJ
MATDTAPDLLQQWSLGELTAERAIGQLLQHLQQTQQQLRALEQRTRRLEQQLNIKA